MCCLFHLSQIFWIRFVIRWVLGLEFLNFDLRSKYISEPKLNVYNHFAEIQKLDINREISLAVETRQAQNQATLKNVNIFSCLGRDNLVRESLSELSDLLDKGEKQAWHTSHFCWDAMQHKTYFGARYFFGAFS